MSFSVRQLTPEDAEAAWQLGFEAFGVPSPRPGPATVDLPGRTWFGAFLDDLLVGRMVDRAYDSYFGGALVPTCGIAAVTLAAEYRGLGGLTPLFIETLRFALQRGAVISTLFPTAPGIYRRFGYELIADFCTVELRTAMLAAVPRPARVRTRRATVVDFDAIRAVYDAWAVEQNGPLSRRGVSFPATAEEFLSSFTAVTVALDEADRVCGYASWNRGQGYGEQAVLSVADLLATTPDGYRALLATMGSFASVTALTRIDTSGDDLIRLFLPALPWQVSSSSPYMLKILDVPGAVGLRHYPPGLTTELRFRLEGDFLTANNGSFVLTVSGGAGQCVRDDHGSDRIFTSRGLALLYAGVQSCANLRAAGLLSGGDVAQDLNWDAAFGARQAHIRDFF